MQWNCSLWSAQRAFPLQSFEYHARRNLEPSIPSSHQGNGSQCFTGEAYAITRQFPFPLGARKEVVNGLYQGIFPRSRCKNGVYTELFQFLHIILRYHTTEYNLNPVT